MSMSAGQEAWAVGAARAGLGVPSVAPTPWLSALAARGEKARRIAPTHVPHPNLRPQGHSAEPSGRPAPFLYRVLALVTQGEPLGGSRRTGRRVKGPRPRRSGPPGVRLADRSPQAAGEPRRLLSWVQRGRGSSGVGGFGALWGRQLPSGQTRGESHLVQGSTLLVKPLRLLL